MKKLLILVALFVFSINCFSGKPVQKTVTGGKKNDDGTVTYYRVYSAELEKKIVLNCSGKGPNLCSYTYSQVCNGGQGNCYPLNPDPLPNVDICSVEEYVISLIKKGEIKGNGILFENTYYSFTDGSIDEDGIASYELMVNDEPLN